MDDFTKTETLQNLIRSMDDSGRAEFFSHSYSYIERESKESEKEYFQRMCLSHVYDYGMLTLLPKKYKSHARRLDVEATRIGTSDKFIVSFNLARMLMLPGLDIPTEVRVLDAFIETWKEFYVEFAKRHPTVTIKNDRTANNKTVGKLSFALREKAGFEAEVLVYEQAAAARISACPVLTHWVTQMALALNKLGRYSWFVFRSETIFGRMNDPVMLSFREEYEEKKTAKPLEISPKWPFG